MLTSTSNDSFYDVSAIEISFPRSIRFWFLLLVDIPSSVYLIFDFPLFIVQVCGLSHVKLNPQIEFWFIYVNTLFNSTFITKKLSFEMVQVLFQDIFNSKYEMLC
jgi:hypothetical protein